MYDKTRKNKKSKMINIHFAFLFLAYLVFVTIV